MAITSIHCPVLGAHISRVTNFEDRVTGIICPEYDHSSGFCRLKNRALEGGPLSRLLERVSEGTLESRSTRCDLGPN